MKPYLLTGCTAARAGGSAAKIQAGGVSNGGVVGAAQAGVQDGDVVGAAQAGGAVSGGSGDPVTGASVGN